MAIDVTRISGDNVPFQVEDGDEEDIRFSLTALGEAFVIERAGKRFRGFGPCTSAMWPLPARPRRRHRH